MATNAPHSMRPSEEEELLMYADDPDYWDYLDSLEFELGGVREWDLPVGGAS